MKKTVLHLLSAVLILLLCACSRSEEPKAEENEYYRFTDSVGNEIVLSEKPAKVAVLFSSYAEVWRLSGGSVDITVGEAIQRGFADENSVLVDEGAGHTTINLELLAAEKPDFVIGTADYACQVAASEFMSGYGVASALFKVDDFDDYLEMLKICCDINGTPESYAEHGESVKHEIEALLENVSSSEPVCKKILFMRAGSTAKSTKAKSSDDNFACKMLRELGTTNIADSCPALLDGLSMETIVAEKPDCIFISSMGDADASREYVEELFQSTVWQQLDCVKNGNYYFLPKDLFHFKPNAKWSLAYNYLINILYPETESD